MIQYTLMCTGLQFLREKLDILVNITIDCCFFGWYLIHSSDEARSAPATLVTRCYVPHFHHYGDISIEILQLKK